jgi:hypothetical protein
MIAATLAIFSGISICATLDEAFLRDMDDQINLHFSWEPDPTPTIPIISAPFVQKIRSSSPTLL